MQSTKIVASIPMESLWTDSGPLTSTRLRYLSVEELGDLVRSNPVRFVVANVGELLRWIPDSQCYEFWNTEVIDHLVSDPTQGFRLEDFPGDYAYLASEWTSENKTPIVMLEKCH